MFGMSSWKISLQFHNWTFSELSFPSNFQLACTVRTKIISESFPGMFRTIQGTPWDTPSDAPVFRDTLGETPRDTRARRVWETSIAGQGVHKPRFEIRRSVINRSVSKLQLMGWQVCENLFEALSVTSWKASLGLSSHEGTRPFLWVVLQVVCGLGQIWSRLPPGEE